MRKLINIIIALSILSFTSCKNDNEEDCPTTVTTSDVTVMFEHVFKSMSNSFELNTKYTTENGDTITATKLAYFISNVILTNSNGDIYTESASYHLVQKEDGEMMDMFILSNVPIGTYTKIEFSIGVDAVANITNDQDGDLDPSNNPNMIWNWNTGYKFFVFEGNYISKNGNSGGISNHIGKDENYKSLSFDNLYLTVETSTDDEVMFKVDVSQLWKNPTTLDIENYTSVSAGTTTEATTLSNNYAAGMFMQHHAN